MRYLSGAIRKNLPAEVGYMLTPNMGNRPDLSSRPWAADTGCFKQGADFSIIRYLAFLASRRPFVSTCMFATAPDVVGDAAATWERSREALPLIRALGFPAALVAQDGIESMAVEWGDFDCLFIGGTTRWKLSPATSVLVTEAKRLGKWVHMGRVNSLRRLQAASLMGCDSVDGTYLAFRARGGRTTGETELADWMRRLRDQPFLPLLESPGVNLRPGCSQEAL